MTEEMKLWALTLVHGCPFYGFFQELSNRISFYWDLVAIYNRDLILDVGFEGGAHTEFSSADEDYIRWIHQAFNTLPCLGDEFENPNGEFMLYITEIDRDHMNTHILDNPQAFKSLLGLFTIAPIAQTLAGFVETLPVKSQAALATTSKAARKFVGYDPFQGRDKNALLGLNAPIVTVLQKDVLDQIAFHAFNNIYDVIQPYVTKTKKLSRPGDVNVQKISIETYYGPKKDKKLIEFNCLAQTIKPSGEIDGAVNFVFNDWSGNSGKRVNGLLQNERLHLNKSEYFRTSQMHGEIRLMERHHDNASREPIYVDKFCCPFCAVQFIAMGLMELTPGAVNNNLQWYTFSPYVLYFKSRRIRMWGQQIETLFRQMNVNQKAYFLNKLATSCSINKHETAGRIEYLKL